MTPLQMKIVAMAERHMERVVDVARNAERRRRERNCAKSRACYHRKSDEEKLALSRRRTARMKELHGEDYFAELGRAWRGTASGKASIDSYNGSEKHRACQRAYRASMLERDREGMREKAREWAARARTRAKARALWMLVEWNSELKE